MGPICQWVWVQLVAPLAANDAATSARRSWVAGDHPVRRRLAGVALGAAAGCAEGTRREPVLDRIQPKKLEGAGWPETRQRRAMAAVGDRVGAGLALRHANELGVALV